MMTLDLTDLTIDGVSLGTPASKVFVGGENGVIFRFEDDRLDGFHIRLSDFYGEGAVFIGKVVFLDGLVFNLSAEIQPDHVLPHFFGYHEYWDDEVEVNFQFLVNGVRIEFSWHHSGEGVLVANYVDVEYA